MEKQTSDEYSSRLSNYDKLVLGDPSIFEMAIPRMSNPQLIEFYEYCQEKVEAEEDKCELYWYATLFLEETQVVKMYRDGQLYVDTTHTESIDPVLVEETLTEEDMAQINSIVELINQRKKEKRNPLRRLIRNIKGR